MIIVAGYYAATEVKTPRFYVSLGFRTSCGDLRFCALAAQEQGEPADQAVDVDETNCASGTHVLHKYTYRQIERKTFLRNSSPASEGYALR